MSGYRLRCLLDGPQVHQCSDIEATAAPATVATTRPAAGSCVADVAPVAVAGATGRTVERRRARLEAELHQHPERRIATDVANAPLRPESGEPVSVVMAVRTAEGIVAGEFTIPRERFDAALFLQFLNETSERPS